MEVYNWKTHRSKVGQFFIAMFNWQRAVFFPEMDGSEVHNQLMATAVDDSLNHGMELSFAGDRFFSKHRFWKMSSCHVFKKFSDLLERYVKRIA